MVQCIHTASASCGTLRDLDGVRCWLPCIDALDQRLVFDVRIKAPRTWRIACCGKKISTYLLPIYKPTSTETAAAESVVLDERKKISRFFTPYRIPAVNVGFFMGRVEMHKMPLYRLRSRIWVATGLQDALCVSDASAASGAVIVGAKRDRSSVGDTSQGETDEEMNGHRKATRGDDRKFTFDAGFGAYCASAERKSEAARASGTLPKEPEHRRLYYDDVHHSVLGLDMATRMLHKFCGHRYDYDEFTVVFVADLGHDFASFDGLTLIDARFLHSSNQIHMETPANLMILRAYLYSWFKSALHISSYEAEFIIHGVVEYLLNYYCEIFGEDDAKYRFQKRYDTVVALEKQGRGFPLSNFFPETYEVFDVYFAQYLTSKSAVLLQLMEHRIGGKDPMRIALKQLIRSPGIYSAAPRQYKGANKDIINNFQSLFDATGISLPNATPPSSSMVDQALRQGMSQQEQLMRQRFHQQSSSSLYVSGDDSSSIGGASPYTPSLAASTPFSTTGGDFSPYSTLSQGGMSPYNPYSLGNVSPYHQGIGSMSPYGGPYYMGSKSPFVNYGMAMGATSPLHDPYAVSPDVGSAATGVGTATSSGGAGTQYDVSYSPVVDPEARIEAAEEGEVKAAEPAAVASDATANSSDSSHGIAVREGLQLPAAADKETTAEEAKTSGGNESMQIEGGDAIEETAPTHGVDDGKTASAAEGAAAASTLPQAGSKGYYASMARHQALARNMASGAGEAALAATGSDQKSRPPLIPSAVAIPALVRSHSGAGGGYTPSMLSALKVRRQNSITSESGWERDFSLLTSDCISAENFLELLRHASDATTDLDKSFLDRYVLSCGVYLIRSHVCIAQKADQRSKFTYVTTDQIGYKAFGAISADCCQQRSFLMHIAESHHDMVTEMMITVSGETEQCSRQAVARSSSKRRRSSVGKQSQGLAAPNATAEIAMQVKKEAEKEMRKSALQKSRDVDHRLKYVCHTLVPFYSHC